MHLKQEGQSNLYIWGLNAKPFAKRLLLLVVQKLFTTLNRLKQIKVKKE